MRCLVIAAVLLGSALAHRSDGGRSRRKSLGFGPKLPQAVYHASQYQIPTNGFVPQPADSCPYHVAKLFVDDVLSQLPDSSSYQYKIRKDSYTDKNTGITHVYVRQLLNGLEVADGDMNLNIKDGKVLSYGNSFYVGPTPQPFTNPNLDDVRHPHKEFCAELESEYLSRLDRVAQSYSANQVVMGSVGKDAFFATHPEVAPVADTYGDHCGLQQVPYNHHLSQAADAHLTDVEPAILQFMIVATPNGDLESEMLNNFDQFVKKMVVVPQNNFFAPENTEEAPVMVEIHNVPETVNPVKGRLAYVQVPTKAGDKTEVQLVWKFEVEMKDNWYEAAVSATAPHRIISVVDWASDSPIPTPDPTGATYKVLAWGINDPEWGERTVMKENFDALASPMGWHAIPFANDPSFKGVRKPKEFYRNTTTTWGNNVFAQENWEGQNSFIDNHRPDAGKDKVFDYVYAPKVTNKTDAQSEAYKHINATVAQLFYTSNMVHDLFYRYGFDEVSGNFQQYNFERGGAENDAVIANAQDGSGYNNANFMTPPDGQNGRMRMYLWNTDLPYRDGDFEAGIVIHELAHGLSTRLTGGPANSGCLGFGESGGMGEGWGDFLATTIRSTETYSDYPMGAWAANRVIGIRNYPYSLNETINPSTYKTLDKPGYWGVHAIGEVWAQMLWLIEQDLIKEHGFSPVLFPPQPDADGKVPLGDFYRPGSGKKAPIPKHGNTLLVQLVINGMKLQPCRPYFFDARDAIIQADQELTGGENFCTLWKGFSKRGLGQDAKYELKSPWGGGIRTNGYAVPTTCQ